MQLSLCAQPFSAQHIDFCHNLPSINRHYAYIEQGRICVLRVSGQPVYVGLDLILSHARGGQVFSEGDALSLIRFC